MDTVKQFFRSITNFEWVQFLTSKIRYKLLFGFLLVTLIPLLGLAVAMFGHSTHRLNEATAHSLQSLRIHKSELIQQWIETLRSDAMRLSESNTVADAMIAFQQSFPEISTQNNLTDEQQAEFHSGLRSFYERKYLKVYNQSNAPDSINIKSLLDRMDSQTISAQHYYLSSNPKPLDKTEDFLASEDFSVYTLNHESKHAKLLQDCKTSQFDNFYFVEPEEGRIVYSIQKQIDFGTSLKNGFFANTHLGHVYRRALNLKSTEHPIISDVIRYAPALGAPVGFVALPVFQNDKQIGVFIAQYSDSKLASLLDVSKLPQQTAEVVLLGGSQQLLNPPRLVEESETLPMIGNTNVKIDSDAATYSLRGEEGIGRLRDYRGITTLASWGTIPITQPDRQALQWGLVSKMDQSELTAPVWSSLWNALLIAGLTALLLAAITFYLVHPIIDQTESINDMLSLVGMGDFDARADVITHDELGTVAESLNSLCDNTLVLIQSREERRQIELAIAKLKEEVGIVASGDLTVEADVTGDVTGDIADSVNYMVGQLRAIISNVQDATVRVSSSANEIRSTTEELSDGSETQSTQIRETSQAIQLMASSIQQVSRNTKNSAEVALKARESAQLGHRAVKNTIEGMERIRTQVQSCSKRIKRLGETSQEVGEIVQLISDIADRTSILALNASIQAATAGDAGQGFAVVAEEVERLAERCNEATRQISSLIKGIQQDTNEAITAMEESTSEVVQGSELALEAGQALGEIDDVSQKLADLITSISDATTQQAQGAESVAHSMEQIAQVSQQTATGTRETAESVSNLAHLADTLHGSVSAFRLPQNLTDSSYVFDIDHESPSSSGGSGMYSGILKKRSSGNSSGM